MILVEIEIECHVYWAAYGVWESLIREWRVYRETAVDS